ncbi:hypothetical protein FRB90_007003 [Tulasnella sp. 427]|nr:hypothetical protein FRB90_007003 [Tulasnella sp. 427]
MALAYQKSALELQVKSKLAQVPQDIFFLMAALLHLFDLSSLVRACKYFSLLFEPDLYRHITSCYDSVYYRNECLFRTLVERPNLIPYIKYYRGPLLPNVTRIVSIHTGRSLRSKLLQREQGSNLPNVGPVEDHPTFKRAIVIFPKATNIEELYFTDLSTWMTDPLFEPIVVAVSKMPLRKLALWRSDQLLRVLRDQPNLEELDLRAGNNGLEDLQNTGVPNLKRVTASLTDASFLVPGRPVERLTIVSGFEPQVFDERLFNKLSLSARPIIDLKLDLDDPNNDNAVENGIRMIAQSLPNLKSLTLSVGGTISAQVISGGVGRSCPNSSRCGSAAITSLFNDTQVWISNTSMVSWLTSFIPNSLRTASKPKDLGRTKPSWKVPLNRQVKSMLVQIPEDIFLLILDKLDTAALSSLVRTCQQLHVALEPVLYRHITFPPSWTYHREDKLFQTLDQRQDLLPHIRTYHGPFLPLGFTRRLKRRGISKFFTNSRRDSPPLHETPMLKVAITIFTQATNIVDLQFNDSRPWTSEEAYAPIARAVSALSLRRLTIFRTTDLLQTLRDQPELEELELGAVHHGLDGLQPTDVPNLRTLTACLQEAAMLVPGRPIKKLRILSGGGELYDPLFRELALSTMPVTELSVDLGGVHGHEKLRDTIRLISRTLPDVECLTLSVHGGLNGAMILEEVPAFRSIRSLTLEDVYLTDGKAALQEGSSTIVDLLVERFISYLEGILLDNSSPDATADPRERQIQSKMAQIPQEIILVIANRLNKAALASLIQTCRYFHFMLEPTLYREINTTIPWRDKKADLLLRTLANRSDLFATIRAYHGPLALIPQPTPKPNLIKRILRVENSISNWFLSSPVPTVSFFTQAINIVNLELTDDYNSFYGDRALQFDFFEINRI